MSENEKRACACSTGKVSACGLIANVAHPYLCVFTCVYSISDRDVARIAVVDEAEAVVYDQYVKPDKPIVSYLTQLTGITERCDRTCVLWKLLEL